MSDPRLPAHRISGQGGCSALFQESGCQHGLPEKVTIDKSGANTATLVAFIEVTGAKIEVRQTKYLNNGV